VKAEAAPWLPRRMLAASNNFFIFLPFVSS
jgi:hypothetical protein